MHQSKAALADKIANETGFAVLGRAIADAYAIGSDTQRLITLVMERRYNEQMQIDKETAFAALARQIGDAARNGKDLRPILERMAELRRRELGPN